MFYSTLRELSYGLGVKWLPILDDILWNFGKIPMKFVRGEELCDLQGNGIGMLQMRNSGKMDKLLMRKGEVA